MSKNELFIEDNYLIVYQDSKLYYLQKIENKSKINELITYIQKSLNLDELTSIPKNKVVLNKQSSHEFSRVIKSNLFNYFFLYLFLLCIGFYSFDFIKKEPSYELENIQKSSKNLKKEIVFKYISKEITLLFKMAEELNIQILSLSFKESKFMLTLSAKEKKSLYAFLEKIKNSSVENMLFNKELKRYMANASFKVNRR